MAGRPVTVYGPEAIRQVCLTFVAGTSCPDGLPCRLVSGLSDEALRIFGKLLAGFVAAGRWPTAESIVHVVLLPKESGGERPVGLSRSAARIVAKLYGQRGRQRLADRSPAWSNTLGGRRVGDGARRSQWRSAVWTAGGGCSAEMAIDLAKAFGTAYRLSLIHI